MDENLNFKADESESTGMLYPRDSETRDIKSLDGMWNFRADASPTRREGEVIPMPVPSSYNDITQEKSLRDFVGWAWYDKEFFVSHDWMTKRWVNGQPVMEHDGGHLPFEAEVNNVIHFGGENLVTVAVNNTLTPHTLPPGTIKYETNTNRSVKLYTTPKIYISDITIQTKIQNTDGVVNYTVVGSGTPGFISLEVEILDKSKSVVGRSTKLQDQIVVQNANFWWPYTMNPKSPGYLYLLKVTVKDTSNNVIDVYRQPFGIRTVSVTANQLLINGAPFYCHGVAKHEDSDIRGKGLDFPLIAKDFNMLKWLGVNCFRTSHYPYAEEIMDQADQQGIVVIDESPGVMEEMVRRDKNRPSVVMWSVANEPDSGSPLAAHYFKSVISHTKNLDMTRPVTFVANSDFENEKVGQYVDVLCINRYYAWYSDCGHTEVIQKQLTYDLTQWHQKYNKPIIITEYGADTIPGLHQEPSFVFTEEYQVDFLSEYHKVFDALKSQFLVGEMVWNFADFMTIQQITRVVGNKKGLLTRQRQPKMSGHLIRSRYQKLINNTFETTNSHYNRLFNDFTLK
ncbi:hypothetical protein KUTeg_018039 [Tegillarca granosa]|uniref:Beta-glucuronidase n=1 Tax=Tegillarca granosa TaxID=220873 RepID=A0ABQ9EJ59_TEGGR|nr:hypothetical protein KUTeg_018039 [Tegillarca granosa]